MEKGGRPDLIPIYGDPKTRTEKPCKTCGTTKPLDEFTRSRNTPDGRAYNCRECRAAQKRDRRYGLSAGEYDAMLEEQGGVCRICKKTCLSGQRLSVDHNHTTGEVRALLCRKCNSGIANFCDNAMTIRNAAYYLAAYGSSPQDWDRRRKHS